ncbi:muscular LMNA-interacting protein isoform X11 [Chionomys nivalis]|uniref:muscular LMNA-interacting protein isoform X11 n=1 Tax=Chionomys nivalis TaxID=269649 RepID=UPI00259277E7|nr:muscular LMNA-interacting protein isoform X11 [Chionomys nivalis]
MLPEQGLLSDCGNNYFQMTSCILAGNIETTPKVSPGDSEAKPLIFTFVPTVRRLPTHIQVADTSKFLVKIPEESRDKSPESVNRFEHSDHMTFSCESKQERDQRLLASASEGSGRNSQGKKLDTNDPLGMQKGDLFKAEYVFIVDSDGEDEATSRQSEQGPPGGVGNIATRPKSLAISSSLASDVVRPKVHEADLKTSSHPEIPHAMAPQQKHAQKTPPVPANVSGACVLEEFHTRRLDVTGASVEETATYFHTAAHDSPFSAWRDASSLVFSPSTQLPGSSLCGSNVADHSRGLASEAQKKASTSHVLNPREDLRPSPSSASGASLKSPSASYIPVRIVMHSLSPSPKPLTSSLHGSLSTVSSRMSSTGNLSKSGLKSSVPSRLSLLTAILKSNPSHQRPLSPASCPTFSLNSLASSTLTLDQKVKQSSPTPKKSLSSCSLTAGSTEQEEHKASAETYQSYHLPFFSKSPPLSQLYPLSPAAPDSSIYASRNVEKTPQGTLRSSTTLPQLQSDTFGFADVPSITSSVSPLSSLEGRQDGDLRGSERSRNICKHPSTFLSSASPANESPALSSLEKCFHPSPVLSELIDRSQRACSQQLAGQELRPSVLPAPPVSRAGSTPHANLGLSILPPESSLTQGLQPSPSVLHPSCGSGARTGTPESTVSNHSSLVPTPSLPVSLTRTKELSTPCTLSMSTGSENKKPKTPSTHPRAAGRETKYANLLSTSSTASESQLTKPGVIRPVPVKSKLLLKKEEEVYEPNPFSKYLEDSSDLFSEQDAAIPHRPVSLHPLYQSKLYPPVKSLMHPQTLSHADCLTPGPFSHLSSFSLRDEQEKSPTLLSQDTHNKLGIFSVKPDHPMVAIPEHDILDSKE